MKDKNMKKLNIIFLVILFSISSVFAANYYHNKKCPSSILLREERIDPCINNETCKYIRQSEEKLINTIKDLEPQFKTEISFSESIPAKEYILLLHNIEIGKDGKVKNKGNLACEYLLFQKDKTIKHKQCEKKFFDNIKIIQKAISETEFEPFNEDILKNFDSLYIILTLDIYNDWTEDINNPKKGYGHDFAIYARNNQTKQKYISNEDAVNQNETLGCINNNKMTKIIDFADFAEKIGLEFDYDDFYDNSFVMISSCRPYSNYVNKIKKNIIKNLQNNPAEVPFHISFDIVLTQDGKIAELSNIKYRKGFFDKEITLQNNKASYFQFIQEILNKTKIPKFSSNMNSDYLHINMDFFNNAKMPHTKNHKITGHSIFEFEEYNKN